MSCSNNASAIGRQSAIDARITRHRGYDMSQSRRHDRMHLRLGHGTMRKTKHRGIGRVVADFLLN
jgi:hypothetical protein